MSFVDLYRLYGYVVQWAASRNCAFKHYWPVKGGWEGWIQVDLAASILKADNSIHVLRDQPIYCTNDRVDLLLNASSLGKQVAMEIKAQSFDNRGKFALAVQEDMNRLTFQRDDKFSRADCLMLALPFDRIALDQVLAMEWRNRRVFRNFSGFIEKPEIACCMAAWNSASEWHQPLIDG